MSLRGKVRALSRSKGHLPDLSAELLLCVKRLQGQQGDVLER